MNSIEPKKSRGRSTARRYAGTPLLVLIVLGFAGVAATELGYISKETSGTLASALFVLFPMSIAAMLLIAGEFDYESEKRSVRFSRRERAGIYWSTVIGLFAVGVALLLWITVTNRWHG